MTPLTSSIPAVKGALVDALNARPALAGKVTWGVPRETPRREWIVVGEVEGDQSQVSVGRQSLSRREERYRVLVVVSVIMSAVEHPRTVAERAYALAAEVEDEVRTSPTLGLDPGTDGLYWAQVTKTDLTESTGDGSERQAVVTLHVSCMARI